MMMCSSDSALQARDVASPAIVLGYFGVNFSSSNFLLLFKAIPMHVCDVGAAETEPLMYMYSH